MMITLKHIISALLEYQGKAPDLVLAATEIDSRRVIPGSLFIALTGERVDGHAFIADAFKQGALIAIVQQDISNQFSTLDLRKMQSQTQINFPKPPFCLLVEDSLKALQQIARYWRRQLKIRVIGITGSVGKSTTKELVAEILSQKYHTFKNPGNYNNEIGLPLTILNMGKGYERAVLEMGFYYPGEISFLCDIALPQVGIITNIGTVHAERAGSQAEIVKGKTELVQSLPAAPEGIAILNFDDPLVISMASKTKARIITYGLNDQADVWADHIISNGLLGIEFDLHYSKESFHLSTPLIGRHSVMTALRGTAAGIAEGLTINEISRGLAGAQSQLRMVVKKSSTGALILDDSYNATPESTMAALDILYEVKGLHIAVLGDMLELGEYELQGHEQVGKHAASKVDILIAVGFRSKNMVESAIRAGLPAGSVHWFEDALQALDPLKKYLKEGTVVLVKGSHGMRMERITTSLEEIK
jgi:UDP-N-acetylmuramoyl-tripeptide--D-alanyl-D-alanine ligase